MTDKINLIEKDNLEALYAISQIAAQAKDLPTLWEPLLAQALAVLKVDAGSLMILEEDFLLRKAVRGLGEEIMQEAPIPTSSGGISWRVVRTRQPAIVTDLSKEKIASKELSKEGFHSLVAVPMMVRDEVIGVMSVFTRKERQFSAEDLRFFSIIANQAALAVISISSTELLKENRRRLEELEALNQISKSVSTLFDFEETLSSLVSSITRLLRADKGVLVLFDHKDQLLKAVSPAYGLTPSQVRDLRTRSDEGITGQAFCQGVPIMKGVLDPATQEILRRAKITGVKSVLAAPLKVKSQTLGVIQVFSTAEENFHPDDRRLFTILSSQVAVMVNSASMYREIEEERKKDAALLASIGEGVLAIDKNQKITHLNLAGEKMTGFLAEELLEKTFSETICLYDKDKQPVNLSDSPIGQVLRNGQSQTSKDFYLKKRSNSLFPCYLSLAAVYNAEERIVGAIVVFRDITYELELEQMKQELISIATHELRSPITLIKGNLAMILDGDTGGVSGETKETIEELAKINQRLADLVDDLLNVGRLEQGRIKIKIESVDLRKLIEEEVKEYLPQAREKNLNLSSSKNDIPQVRADREKLRQVLENLISNAIKYTPEKSQSSKFKSQNNRIEISLEQKGREVICRVKDHGLGISSEGQKKLFEKFYRVKTAQTREITGTGLGLWITKKLIEMMGGKIWFTTVENKGSSFYFSLPACKRFA